ncbi:23S rRNA (adenine(1618)-N(6))-methyltransferase RlmF [Cellulophaga baltica]|uniref:23S rRNA (adenine(1618)-N(6))-methyltransferase RlmF n=1 Tax=Cellulophaga TaxID=104264 RepID=UPI001C079C03|nr:MULTISPECIES: 23S rRNA (adenine(1618)-N(6))-methyltransferase RlmF [Cellulophaga]MBU2996249.1 23S rRNA (adenine(1618)-N(6))-methyltransferase RlmF [Cellulophaga baltica]MDO6767644.1 23S rRNA (adenine(1618)-N(6))-methyltransferase RlmF [Cellulophaga sp. 1_MG-2023]
MHANNIHNGSYDFETLIKTHTPLENFVFVNNFSTKTIDFSNNLAVLHLNKALLKHYYQVTDWNIPNGYLCPPIPGRADYLHHIHDLLDTTKVIKGLDIGVGSNCIYPILASQLFDWKMVGADINETAVNSANENIATTKKLQENIEIRHQQLNANLFKGIINTNEYFDFTMCNPPFHSSEKEANTGSLRKVKNLDNQMSSKLNFGGQANELWCNGGEGLFIKRMIKQSCSFKKQVGWFTCLVSKSENLKNIYKQLTKAGATYKTIDMNQGNKKSRFVAWQFVD